MNPNGTHRDPVELVAEEFLQRYRRGEKPVLTEFVERFPELAEQIRALFPTLLLLERLPPLAPGPSAAEEKAAPEAPTMPERLGDYRLLRELGRGGMGVVYEAVQESLGRHVALKVLPINPLLSPTQLERFRREARAAAKLHHTNIVPVFEVGAHEGVHYYAMQYIHGQALDAILEEVKRLQAGQTSPGSGVQSPATLTTAQGMLSGQLAGPGPAAGSSATGPVPLPVSGSMSHLGMPAERPYYRSVARLGVQAAEALEYAHRQGILHRDIKPSNLLLDAQGTLWITDFGLAKTDDEQDLTASGDVVGTLRFLAPERFRGKADARSDVYALGATLYEMVALRPALEAIDQVQLVERATRGAVPSLHHHDAQVPLDLATIIHKALSSEPERRYPSARELAEDLRRYLEGKPIQARRSSWAEHTWRWCLRNPWVASLSAIVILLLFVVALGASTAALGLRASLKAAEQARQETEDRLWDSLVEQGHARRLTHEPGRLFASLDALDQAAALRNDPRLRNEYIACFALSDLRPANEFPNDPQENTNSWCDDWLERRARCDVLGQVHVSSLPDGREFAHQGGFAPSPDLCLSPHGRFLAVLDRPVPGPGGKLMLFRVEPTGLVRLPLERAEVARKSLAFSPDGTLLACQLLDGWIELYETATGQCLRRVEQLLPLHPRVCLALHPSNRSLAVSHQASVEVLPLDGVSKRISLPQTEMPERLAWHPDGDLLAVSHLSGRIGLWDVAAGQCVRVFPPHSRGLVLLAFSHRGDLLGCLEDACTYRLFETYSGAQLFLGPWIRPSFSADDRLLGISGHGYRLRIWEHSRSQVYRTLVPSTGQMLPRAALDAAGNLLAVAGDSAISVWDLPRGKEVAVLPLPEVTDVAFEPGGSLLASTGRGVARCPVAAPSSLGIVPRWEQPTGLPQLGRAEGLAVSRDGRTLAVAEHPLGKVIQQGESFPFDHDAACFLAIDPSGHWLATGTRTGGQVKVWNLQEHRLQAVLPLGGSSRVSFSPDSKRLTSDDDGVRLWEVGTWKEEPALELSEPVYRPAFAPDGRLLAAENYYGFIVLVDLQTRREIARLEDPNRDHASWLAFTPDGTRIVSLCIESRSVHIWDLRQLRRQLAQRGLDWDYPPFSPVTDEPAGSSDSRSKP
jgi:serine/threonine protein kinase/WD40 repeat protein